MLQARRELMLYVIILFFILVGTIVLYFLYIRPASKGAKISFTTISPARFSILNGPKDVSKPTAALINDPQSWENLKKRLVFSSRRRELPAIDFSRQSVLVVFAGSQDRGGNQLEIKKIYRQNEQIRVEALLTIPGKNCLDTPYYSVPIVLSIIPKTEAKVELELSQEKKPCSAEKRLHAPLPL